MPNERIIDLIGGWSDEIAAYALALVAVGTLSMALLEAFKGIFKLRASFHERFLKRWLTSELLNNGKSLSWVNANEKLQSFLKSKNMTEVSTHATQQIISLATGTPEESVSVKTQPYFVFSISPERALYTLEISKMMGQVQDAVDVILLNPKKYLESYLLFTNNVEPEDVLAWLEYCSLPYPETKNIPDEERENIANINNRIQQSVQRQLDSFQLRTGYIWARRNQIYAIILGALVLFSALWVTSSEHSLLTMVTLSLLGGIAAPVSKDLVSNLRKVGTNE